MAESEDIAPQRTDKSPQFKIVEAKIDQATAETLDAVRFYGSKHWHEVMGNLHKPGHRTHNSAKGRTYPRKTRII